MAAVHQINTHKVSFAEGALNWLTEQKAKVARYRLYRETMNELSALSNSDLADLGLNRSMIKRLAYQAAYENQ